MPLENEVEKESTIELPRPINSKEAGKFIVYITKEIPANIQCFYSGRIVLVHDSRKGRSFLKKYKDLEKLEVSLASLDGRLASESFEFERDPMDSKKLVRIKFSTIIDYDRLSDYRPEVINLWREVRKLTDIYFKS